MSLLKSTFKLELRCSMFNVNVSTVSLPLLTARNI